MTLHIKQHSSHMYSPRTWHNAKSADLTVAFAVDFSTAGERLTRNAAGDSYLAISLDRSVDFSVGMLFEALKGHEAKILNVAGNGIYTLARHGWDQARINRHLFEILKLTHALHPLSQVISGGQTGVDLAGIVAAVALDIDAVATLPKGFLQRGEDNQDRRHIQAEIESVVIQAAKGLQVKEEPLPPSPSVPSSRGSIFKR